MMGIKTIEAEQPRLALVFADELDRLFGTPRSLMKLGRDAMLDVAGCWSAVEFVPAFAFGCKPLSVGVFGPIGLWVGNSQLLEKVSE